MSWLPHTRIGRGCLPTGAMRRSWRRPGRAPSQIVAPCAFIAVAGTPYVLFLRGHLPDWLPRPTRPEARWNPLLFWRQLLRFPTGMWRWPPQLLLGIALLGLGGERRRQADVDPDSRAPGAGHDVCRLSPSMIPHAMRWCSAAVTFALSGQLGAPPAWATRCRREPRSQWASCAATGRA